MAGEQQQFVYNETSLGTANFSTDDAIEAMENATRRIPRTMNAYPEFQASMVIVHYVFPAVILVGTVGNVLSFMVLVRRRVRDTSVYTYLAALACADNVVLYLSAFKTWIRAVFKWELLHVSDVGCRIIMWIFLVSIHMSAWLVVAMTTDRFLVVWFPFKASIWCSSRRARIVTLVMTFVIMLYNLHVFWTLGLRSYRGGKVTACGPSMDDTFMENIFPVMKLISYSVLPFMIVLILNLAITIKLWTNRAAIRRAASDSEAGSSSRSAQNRITIMLLTVSFMWLVLTGPFTLWSVLKIPRGSLRARAQIFLFRTFCFLLLYVNHGINFYLYCLAGRRFRQDLKDVLCGPCQKKQRVLRGGTSIGTTTRTALVKTGSGSPWMMRKCNGTATAVTANDGAFAEEAQTFV